MTYTFQDISYRKVGTGPHLSFLHGFCESSVIWDSVINQLSDRYTCIAIDLPGFGKSENLCFNSIPEVVESIHRLLQHENVTKTVMLGHSMGGYIMAEFINCYPKDLVGAAFIHSTARGDSDLKKKNREKAIRFISKYGTDDFFKLFVPSLTSSQNLEELYPQLDKMVRSTSKTSVIKGLKSMKERDDRMDAIRSFQKPILFIKGSEDTHYPSHDIYEQAAQCDLAQVSLLENVGHLSMYENPKLCLHEIVRFLDFIEKTN